jgi:predicted permease
MAAVHRTPLCAQSAGCRRWSTGLVVSDNRTAVAGVIGGVDSVRQDLSYGIRGLRKDPAFACLAVLTLALGIGAATTIFSVLRNGLLDPYPYAEVERNVGIEIRDATRARPGGRSFFRVAEFLDYQEQVQSFEEVIAGGFEDVLYTTADGTQQFSGALMSANTFAFLGVPAALGRWLTPEDAKPGAPPAFVLSHKTWMGQFGADPDVVGRSFVLNGVPTTLVGVMPPRFTKMAADLYKPLVLDRANPEQSQRYFRLQARLKRGVTLEQAQAEVSLVAERLAKVYPAEYPAKFQVKVVTWVDSVVGQFKTTLYTLAAAVALLLLIACSNVANMLLSRAAAREREMAVRASVGASRGRLVRQLLVESALLALLGAALGCLCSYFGIKALVRAIPEGLLPREAVIRLNLPVLLFSLVVAAATSVLCGLVPALRTARKDLVEPLRDSAKGAGGGFRGRRLNSALVVAEVALSLVLLAGAGLLMRSFLNLQTVDLGFRPDHVLTARLPLPRGPYKTAEAKRQFFTQVLARMEAQPGVVAAAAASSLPPYGGLRSEIEVPGKTHPERWDAIFQLCSEGYFETLRLRLLRGRLLSAVEVAGGRKVAVVNRTLVDRYFGPDDPIGRQIELKMLGTLTDSPVESPVFEVIGVIADAKNQGLQDPLMPEAFIPYTVTGAFERGILVRTAGAPLLLLDSMRREIWAVDRNVALTLTGSLTDHLAQFSYAEPRFGLVVLGTFAALGLVLVALGIFGVIAYAVSRRTHEIGIRMALGAHRSDVLRMVLGMGLRMIGGGMAVGVFASLGVTRVLSSQLFGVAPRDPTTLLAVGAVVAGAGLAACYFPARRATRVDPMVALRYE